MATIKQLVNRVEHIKEYYGVEYDLKKKPNKEDLFKALAEIEKIGKQKV